MVSIFLLAVGCAAETPKLSESIPSNDSESAWLMGPPPVGMEIELPDDSPYRQQVFDWMKQYGRYPRQAAGKKLEGVVSMEFYIDRSGKLLTYRLAKRSGHYVFDYEVRRMMRASDPMPPPPVEIVRSLRPGAETEDAFLQSCLSLLRGAKPVQAS
jgi:TonB family protein